MKKYNLFNNIFGWLSFAIAAIVYLLTIEPTASFWDCGEFIASSYKLEVGHPPGAPFFMMMGKFFTLFASDVTQVAAMVNSMSAIMSALTIMFLFWTITHFSRKLVCSDDKKDMTLGQMIVILGSGLVGALAYTFSDTFWFSAVEGEVYASSSMFTALVFWLILKWENRADQAGADKWLVLIAYVMGLSIGVHLLNLLCIPAIVLVYYFKKHEQVDIKGLLLALAGSFGLIVILMYGVIPGFTKVGGWFELFFVNSLSFSYNTGAMIYLICLLGCLVWGIFETISKKGDLIRAKIAFVGCMSLSGAVFIGGGMLLWAVVFITLVLFVIFSKKITFRMLNTSILCLFVILVGYSSFALIPIRSVANTPMDQNSPENVFTLASYLNREQYGDRPLFYGKTYASKEVKKNGQYKAPTSIKEVYDRKVKKNDEESDKYVVINEIPSYEMDKEMLFPRMYSKEGRHMLGYQIWGGINPNKTNVAPTMLENIRFFFSYQLDFMYFRYFMWNFSGRQNDIQATGTMKDGNWITGIGFIDEYVLGRGPQTDLPLDIADNKGHNVYYGLPFLLGIIGLLYQISRKKKGEQQFLVTFMLFFMTGIAIILYLNQQPFEPRERDYAYAGSFYAYCIWIGMGVAGIWALLKKVMGETPAAAIATVVTLLIPIQMGAQNWDDHDRSERYTMRDFAKNYLDTCEPDAILFTMGDNDTFPLWYMQEVEGYRTDVRVCNLSYLQTDWYVDQMRRQAYDSKPLPITWDTYRYTGRNGAASLVISRESLDQYVDKMLENADMKALVGHFDYNKVFDTKAFKYEMDLGEMMEIFKTKDEYIPHSPYNITDGIVIPSSKLTMKIDTTAIDWAEFNSKPKDKFVVDLGEDKMAVYRQELMIMEMLYNISQDDWKRPIYYATTIGEAPLDLREQSLLEGINYRIYPGDVDSTGVHVDKMFNNLVNKYVWGGSNNPKVYLDENNQRMCRSFRLVFNQLISALIDKGDNERALQALDKCMEVLPDNTVPRGTESMTYVEAYYLIEEDAKGDQVANEILARINSNLNWYSRFIQYDMIASSSDIREQVNSKLRMLDLFDRLDKEAHFQKTYKELLVSLEIFMKNKVVFNSNYHPADALLQIQNRRLHFATEDSEKKQINADRAQIVELMSNYNSSLLEKYY